MEFTQQQYKVSYTITGGLIRSGASGEFETDNKEVIKYAASVRITMTNIYETYNEETQCDDTLESSLIFKINANSNVEAGNLTKKLRELFKLGGKLQVEADFPRYQAIQKSYIVTSSELADRWITFIDGEIKKLKPAK